MNESAPPTMTAFAGAARVLQRRLVLRKGLLFLLKTWRYLAGVLVAVGLVRLLGVDWAGGVLALGLLMAWLAGCFLLAWRKRPGPYAALAYWDRVTGRCDAYANAWWFEQEKTRTPAQELHLRRHGPGLEAALPGLSGDVPLPDARWLPLLWLAAVGFFWFPGPGQVGLPDPALTAEGRQMAVKEGKELEEKKLDADKMASLNEEEKKELEQLQNKVQETAKALQRDRAKTAREVLSELEKRAREAEQLADKLKAGDDAWASARMVAELRKHADTAALGDAVAGRSAARTASEAEGLANKLKDASLALETRDRFAETLKQAGAVAEPEDAKRTVGQHVLGADKNLAQALPKEAGDEFQALADKMKTLAAREKSREQLEKLASQLRQSGSDIAGQGGQGMKQLAGSQAQPSQGQQGPQSQQMMNMQNAPQMQPLQMPGLSSMPPGANQGQGQQGQSQMGQMSPVPGTGQPMAVVPGSGQPGGNQNNNNGAGQPKIFVPIPGMPPGAQPGPAALLGSMPGASPGGLQAGSGTSPLGNAPTNTGKAGLQATVDAQRNADGASSVRAVEGQARAEAASRGAQATTLEAIAAEENALDDQALPPARREQVRRYFTELRKRFEKDN